jgi:hypothetical protein
VCFFLSQKNKNKNFFCKIKRFKKKDLRGGGFILPFFQLLKKRKISPKSYTFKKKSLFSKIVPFFDPRK